MKKQIHRVCFFHTISPSKYNHRMVTGRLSLSLFALVGVIMLVLSSTSFGYLLQVKHKSRSSWMLLWFFLCVILSSIATILTNTGTNWDWAFAPSQDALLILGGVFIVCFAYLYPSNDQKGEARIVVAFFIVVGLGALSYALFFAIRFLSNIPAQLEENRAFYLLTPMMIVLTVFIFLRRSQHISAQVPNLKENLANRGKATIKTFFKPNDQPATALRNYGLALALSLIPAVVTLTKNALPSLFASFLFNFGVVVAIAAIMLVYLTYAPEPTTLSAKLTGISMVTVLLLLGLASVWFTINTDGTQVHYTVLKFIYLVLISSLFIIFLFPFFFRSTLLDPLDRLINGVKLANQGDLEIQVDVRYEDEVGYLTHSFNRMVKSLNEATHFLKSQSMNLEKEVYDRTFELRESNELLNREIIERKNAIKRLDQQLRYHQALAGCSQALLVTVEDETNQLQSLTQALEYLRSGTNASRAYVFRNFEDPDLGLCMRMLAEACADGIQPHLYSQANQKFPWSQLPEAMLSALESGVAHGGSVEKVFASTPYLRDAFLNQSEPLLSIECFPIFYRDQWWGFVGFDDCERAREWDEWEVTLLGTASEMVSNTLQRWDAEAQLQETLDQLELRVEMRTSELSHANTLLNLEIQQRQRVQNDLETRLMIEAQLAIISTRLLQPSLIRDNIAASLEDLARIMNAGRIFLVEFDFHATNQVRDYIEWHKPEILPISEEDVQSFLESFSGLREGLRDGKTIFIEDTAQLPFNREADVRSWQAGNVQSLVLSPLTIDHSVTGVLGCSNLQSSPDTVQMNIRALELVAGMLKSLLQREYLIQTLEEQVAERTRQLTTFLDMAILSDQAQDLADILQPTLLSITQIAACDAVGIHIINEKKSSLELIAQRGIPSEFLQSLSEVEMDVEFSGWLGQGDPYEILGHLESGPVFPEPFCFPGFRAFFANRLSTGGNSLGLLSCYRTANQPFTPFQATLLTALGELLGIIVENYRLRIEAEELAAVEERQRLAREIHDAVSQSVYSLSLFARSANDALDENNNSKLTSNLQEIEATALQSMREMRLLLYQLRDADPGEDIATALDTRFKQVENRLGIQATREIETDIFMPANIQHEVWRIIIEALNNSVKHANASHVHLHIACGEEYLFVSVKDDGIGFDVRDHFPGMGLKNIQARAETLGGHLDIVSKLGQGTQIILKIPMTCLDHIERG